MKNKHLQISEICMRPFKKLGLQTRTLTPNNFNEKLMSRKKYPLTEFLMNTSTRKIKVCQIHYDITQNIFTLLKEKRGKQYSMIEEQFYF
ncbi:unnamed protein product [Paramecium pentaurelia]|uniref:Uncharacterized protein n=1 Tax=Paramecium pentaurelia TaxID=43138 RepID=A0A8S1Y5U2_9CILI|nr:unnamed protein product [Paramecium pentaurelia]CAD8213511.1 unnamed protein product [Paramecium pentaurelia]